MAREFGSPTKRAKRSWKSLMGAGRVGRPFWRVGKGLEGPSRELARVGRDGRGWESLLEGRERSGGPPRWTGLIRRPFLQSREGLGGLLERVRKSWQALPEGREGLEGPTSGRVRSGGSPAGRVGLGGLPGGLGRIGSPQEGPEGVRRPSRKAGRGREAIPECWEETVVPPGGLGGVRRPFWKAGRGLVELRVPTGGPGGLGGPPRVPGGVSRPCRWDGRCCEALPEVQVVSEGPVEGSGGVGSPIRIVEGLEALAKGTNGVGSP